MIEEVKVFRAPFVEPVWPVNYLADRPAAQISGSRVSSPQLRKPIPE